MKMMKMIKVLGIICVVMIISAQSLADTLTLIVENDVFASDNDQHYTHGTRFAYVMDGSNDVSWGMSFGQHMYTPSDIAIPELMEDDRPYGGWLYLGMMRYVEDGESFNFYELDVGVIGPSSLSEYAQKGVHELIDSKEPMGWDNQLDDEFGANLVYQRKNRFRNASANFDVITHYGGVVGTVFTYGNAGLMARVGYNIPDNFGFIHMEPTARKINELGVYAFASLDGRYVVRNAFLDGNWDGDSHSVDREDFVGDFSYGGGLSYKNLELIYACNLRGKEFKGQEHSSRFGTVNIIVHF